MLSLTEMRRVAHVLEVRLSGTLLQKIVQPDEYRLFLVFSSPAAKHVLLFSCKAEFARVCTAPEIPDSAPLMPSFAQYLRAHVSRARLSGVRVWEGDRLAAFCLETRENGCRLIFSIHGARSNIYLVDGDGRLLHAMRPLEITRRELVIGEPWVDPASGGMPAGKDRWEGVPDNAYLEAIAETYHQLEQKREAEKLYRRIDKALTRELDFLERKAINLQEDLGEARQAQEYRRRGELLKGVLHLVKAGAAEVLATDYDTGETLTISIDPKLSPAENLEAYFARYQKDSRGISAINHQMRAVEQARFLLEGLRTRLLPLAVAEPAGLDSLRALAMEPRLRKLLARYYRDFREHPPLPKVRKGKDVPSGLRPKRYKSDSGLEIWVGRNDEGNDYLTARLARGNDLFFHLDGYPGSHVILRTEGKKDPPGTAILDACELAVHFSKLREASRADVHVAFVKDIVKPKGAKPGLVYVRKGRTIHLRRDPRRLESILAARLED